MRRILVLGAVLAGLAEAVPAQEAPPAAASTDAEVADVAPATWLVLEAPDHRIRRTMSPNAVFALHLLDRDAPPPKEGEELTGERGVAVKWTRVAAKDGGVDSGAVGWAYGEVESPEDRVVLADLDGAGTLWLNGDPVAGDLYGYGLGGFPAVLRKGTNRMFVSGVRGGFRLALRPVKEGVHVVAWDVVKPDVVRGERLNPELSVTVLNVSREPVRDVPVRVLLDGKEIPDSAGVFGADALTAWRRRFSLVVPAAASANREAPVVVTIEVGAGDRASRVEIPLEVRGDGEARRVTFRSGIDGTVQQYAVLPSARDPEGRPRDDLDDLDGVVLSLHGASVDCLGQARAYSPKPGLRIVCPTNRRPFGFDWQDWGRLDAYEVLRHAHPTGKGSARPVALTGHSMGGHGTWHLAANDPDGFVAIAPSAGWASFDTYPAGPRPASALSPLWRQADGASDTLALIGNLARIPTFVLHGTADDVVPLAQAETMLAALRAAGVEPEHVFQDGAGHWWDGDAAPGADCVDLPKLFWLLEQGRRLSSPSLYTASGRPIRADWTWTTVDPSVDSEDRGFRIVQPLVYGRPSTLRVHLDQMGGGADLIATENIARLERGDAGGWTPVDLGRGLPPPLDPVREKTPSRSGPMKRAFDREMLAVLPADSAPAHAAEVWQQYRMDLAQWWVRANGVISRVTDAGFPDSVPGRTAGRNLLLYGNADVNSAWAKVIAPDCPIEVRTGFVRIGDRIFRGDDIACFFVRPRADDDVGVVGVLGSTGSRGARLAMTHSLFISGTGWPDYVVWDSRALALGDGGVLAAGWFDAKWRLDGRGFFAWGGEVAGEPPTEGGKK